MFKNERPGAFSAAVIQTLAAARLACDVTQCYRQVIQRILFLERLQWMLHRLHKDLAGAVQTRIVRKPTGDKRQRLATKHVLYERRVDVGHAISETRVGAGHSIMHLVRVKNERITGYTMA